MVRAQGRSPLNPAEALRAMIALRDNNPNPLAKRLYALANPRNKSGSVLRYIAAKEAFTIDILVHELKIGKPALYNIIRELESWGVVHKGYSIDMSLPGANPVLYVLTDADPSLIEEAHKFHLELRGTVNGGVMENPIRLLVAPIVDDVMARVMKYKSKSDWQVPMWEVKDRFREEHGVVPPGFESVVYGLAKEKGWGIVVKG